MRKLLLLGAILSLCLLGEPTKPARGHVYVRQYYDTTWTYHEISSYHYSRYYYRPTYTATTYSYHYVVYYPSYPRYYYYYNPVRQVYWGRYEVDENGKGKGYSLLAEKDRKEKLSDIPESAFPKPAGMPAVPDSSDGEKMQPPPAPPSKEK
jgi:hypothetical protein